MSKALTEQWRNGNIQETYYYVKCPWSEGEVDIRYVHNGVDDWKEIVEPVLSYHDLCELKQELEICKDDKADLYAKLCNALMQLEEANKLLKGLYDDSSCRLDHHGYCQEHGSTDGNYICVQGELKEYLERYGVE